MKVRDYSKWSHEEEIQMRPGEIHEPYNPVPPDHSSELDSALQRVAEQDVGLTGGPRGKLYGNRR